MFALADWMNMKDSEDFRKQKFSSKLSSHCKDFEKARQE